MSKSLETIVLALAVRVFLVTVTAFLVAFYSAVSFFAFGKNEPRSHSEHPVGVSIIVPAYNEEGIVDNLLRDLRDSSFPITEAIVLDDHSTDATYEVAKKMNVTAIRNETNLGKAATLNKGARLAKEDIMVVFDADNRPERNCIKHLLKRFDCRDVGIVAGVTKVSSDGLVSKLASLEFNLCFCLFQPFSSRFSFFPILHGAYFGIKRELASFDESALTEDFDISLNLASKGYKIQFEPEAISYVSPPPSFSFFAKQRERWIRGAVQASFKNKGFSKTVFPHIGFVGLFLTALGYLLPLVWAATLTFVIICYFLRDFLLMYTGCLAMAVYTAIVYSANSRARSKKRDILALPLLGYFYFLYVIWFFAKAVVLEYFGFSPKFNKVPHR